MPQKYFLTTPIYYVNARPHIGHAYTTIVADVLARRHRLLGEDVFFLTGTDEHGQKIERSAAAAGIPPQQFADQVSASFRSLWDRMGITYTDFIRTTEPRHHRAVQKVFQALQANDKIYLSSYTGQYCVSEEMFVEGPPGTIGPDGRPTETVTEENYFFRLSDYQQPLLDLIESGELSIEPESRRNEVLSFLRGGAQLIPGALRDLSISRSSFTWGIPVPADERHVIYVWLDALTNYMTAVGYGSDSPLDLANFEKYWPADLHIVGKEIIRFHCVYWPAFLLAANLPLPKKIVAHGWLLFEDSKMSKSKGNIVRTETILDAFGSLCPPQSPAPNPPTAVILDEVQNPRISPPPAANVAAASVPGLAPGTWLSAHLNSPGAPGVAPEIGLSAHLNSPGAPSQTASSSEVGSQTSGATLSDSSSFAESHPGKNELSSEPRPLSTPLQPVHPTQPNPTTPNLTLPPTAVILDEVQNPRISPPPATPTKAQQDLFASDILRYFLLREIPFGQDGSFSFEAMITRYNADLANGYGNLVSRTLNMIDQYFYGEIPRVEGHYNPSRGVGEIVDRDGRLVVWLGSSAAGIPHSYSQIDAENVTRELPVRNVSLDVAFSEALKTGNYSRALEHISGAFRALDGQLSSEKPWVLAKNLAVEANKLKNILGWHTSALVQITALLYPILPFATASVWCQLGLGDIELAAQNGELNNLQWGGLQPGTKLGPLSPIFPRADKGLAQTMADLEASQAKPLANVTSQADAATPTTTEFPITSLASEAGVSEPGAPGLASETWVPKPAQASDSAQDPTPTDASPQITIDDFAKVELRVAKVLVAERIPKADKLLRLEVDLGYERRQILSGIAEWYTPEDLLGRRIVVITNLAPRKMRGLESHGMLLAASASEGGKPSLATFPDTDDLPLGSRLK